jgi:SAM-dependent methyltransferase
LIPARYTADRWKQRVVGLALDRIKPGDVVLEIGGGDRPTLTPSQRPRGITYVGLDLDEPGLAQGAYDERIAGDVECADERLTGRFDVIVSWNTFEHVTDLRRAFANIHSYLKPGGAFVTLFSGRWAFFALAARVMPHSLRAAIMKRFLGVQPEHHHPVHYDRCSYRQLSRLLVDWGEPAIVPLYNGAGYFAFSPLLQNVYLRYETWTLSRPNLATHYLVTARRRPSQPPTR